MNPTALVAMAAARQNTPCSPANCSVSPREMSVLPVNEASQTVFRAFLCLKKPKSILKLAQRLPDCADVSQPPLRVISLISSLAPLFPFFIKEHFPRGSEKNVTYRFIATGGKNTLSTTKTPAYKPDAFAALFSLLWEPWCCCTKPSANEQHGDIVGAGLFPSPAAVAGV